MEWQTIGHERIRTLLDRQLAAQAVAQAYLFIGPAGVGKRTLATEFASAVLQCTATSLQHVYFNFIGSNLEDVRELIQRLSLRPRSGSRQVGILDGAEQMSHGAANALLKTIEEPSSSTSLILISSQDNVLATIRSRCQVFQFGRLSAGHMSAWTQQRGFGVEYEASLLAADGSPGQFIAQVQSGDAQTVTQWASYVVDLKMLLQAPLSERLSCIAKWAGDDTEAVSARVAAWLNILYKKPTMHANIVKALSVLLEAWRRLQTNANKKLVLQYVCINIV